MACQSEKYFVLIESKVCQILILEVLYPESLFWKLMSTGIIVVVKTREYVHIHYELLISSRTL